MVVLAALFDRRAIIDALVQPGVLVGLLVFNVGFAAYHLLAIDDAFRVGARRNADGRRWSRPRSPLFIGALLLAVLFHSGIGVVGVLAPLTRRPRRSS